MSEQFTKKDVAKHNTSESCWIIIHNKVYDVTDFLNDVRYRLYSYYESRPLIQLFYNLYSIQAVEIYY